MSKAKTKTKDNVKIDDNSWFCFAFLVESTALSWCVLTFAFRYESTRKREYEKRKSSKWKCSFALRRATDRGDNSILFSFFFFFKFRAKWKSYYSLNLLSFLMLPFKAIFPFKWNCWRVVSCVLLQFRLKHTKENYTRYTEALCATRKLLDKAK